MEEGTQQYNGHSQETKGTLDVKIEVKTGTC